MKITIAKARSIGNRLGIDWKKVSPYQFTMGLNEELEHKDVTKGDYLKTVKIVLAHLSERPDYYTRLKKAMRK